MPLPFESLALRVRQLRYPPELRILPLRVGRSSADAIADALVLVLERLASLAREKEPPAPKTVATPNAASQGLSPELAIAFANAYFRLSANLALLAAAQDSKELRGMKRALDAMDQAMRAAGVDCRDLTKEAYDAGRLDFEQLGEGEVTDGIERDTIAHCERPAVFLNGTLVQKSKGLVQRARPARGE